MKSWLKSAFTLCTLLLFNFHPASGWLLRDSHDQHCLPSEIIFGRRSFNAAPERAAKKYLHLIPRPYQASGWICPVCGRIIGDSGWEWVTTEEADPMFNPITLEIDEYCEGYDEGPYELYPCVRGCDWNTEPGLAWCEGECWYAFYFHNGTSDFFPFFLDYLKFCADVPELTLLWPESGGLAEEINNLAYLAFKKYCKSDLQAEFLWDLNWWWEEDQYYHLPYYAVTYLFFYSHYYSMIVRTCDLLSSYIGQFNQEVDRFLDAGLEYLFRALDLIGPKFITLYSNCLSQVSHPRLFYERMLVYSHRGHSHEALIDFEHLADMEDSNFLSPEMLVEGGKLYNESLQFAKSISSLTEAIKKDPSNREAYLERAYAYFETGDFVKAIEDYRVASPVLERITLTDHLLFAEGLISGIAQGGAEGLVEFVPSTLSTLKGMGCGLWALAWHPVDVSKQFVNATFSCIDYLRRSTPKEMLSKLAPEVALLIEEWDTLSFQERGHLIGRCVGKYGVDILCGYGVASGVKVARELKRANSLMTLEACASSAEQSAVVTQAAVRHANHRQTVLSSANLKIHEGRQGKHIKGHRNYAEGKSVLSHKDPQYLVDKYAGTGQPLRGTPGKPGYRERVDFGEIIGDFVDEQSKEAFPSTVGIIHYSQDGVHVHPLRPLNFGKQ